MRKFEDAYKEEVNRLPKFRVDVRTVADEVHHRRMVKKRRRVQAARAAAAAALFVLCGAGTATAVNFQKSIFKVTDKGFTAVSEKAQVLENPEDANIPVEDFADLPPMHFDSGEEGGEEPEMVAECEVMEITPVEYASVEEFLEQETVDIVIPDMALLGGEPLHENVIVYEDMGRVMVMIDFGEQRFYLSQEDYRGVEGYASATSYMGESVNERHFTSAQGLDYLMFDTMENGELVSTHAVISVNGRDLSFDFIGYDQESLENILSGLDFSIYFQEE